MTLEELKDKRNIHVIGTTSAEGSAVIRFLVRQGINKITAHDFKSESEFEESFKSFHDSLTDSEKDRLFKEFKQYPIKFVFRNHYLAGIENADLIFVSQAWFRYEPNFPKLKEAQKKGIPFSSITKLYFSLFPGKIVAVTGSSGKTTTSNLINAILEQSKLKVYFTGNDRLNKQILDEIIKAKLKDILVIEVSNRQLMLDLEKSPDIGVITNLSPNHLDDHGTFENYIKVKKSLLHYQDKDDFAILNYDNSETNKIGEEQKKQSRVLFFSRLTGLKEGVYVSRNKIQARFQGKEYDICSVFDLKIKGPHNIENALAAVAATLPLGIKIQKVSHALKKFNGVKSRLEFVRRVRDISFYEDSSSCNPDGPRYAVQSFKEPIVLIAGGSRKKLFPGEFDSMSREILTHNVRAVVLMGEMKDKICKSIEKAGEELNKSVPIYKVKDLAEAVQRSWKVARRGDVVVMSPGCESFGMFKDYRERAEKFKELVNQIDTSW